MKQLNISPRVGREIILLTLMLAFAGTVFARSVLFAADDTQALLARAEQASAQNSQQALAANRPIANLQNKDGAQQATAKESSSAEVEGMESLPQNQAALAAAGADYIPPPAQPGDYPPHPPLCGVLQNVGGDGMSDPPILKASIDQYQTNVIVSAYNFYVNDELRQSSASDSYVFNETAPGKYTVHVLMDTNFGRTLKHVNCVAGPFIVS
jgi:hypothetical protein